MLYGTFVSSRKVQTIDYAAHTTLVLVEGESVFRPVRFMSDKVSALGEQADKAVQLLLRRSLFDELKGDFRGGLGHLGPYRGTRRRQDG